MRPPTVAPMTDRPDPVVEVRDVPGERRFEALVDGAVAGWSRYVRRPDRVVFLHTEVEPAFEGQGVGSALARGALDQVRAEGLLAEPRCPFVAAWLQRHREYADLVWAPPVPGA